jgi:FlaG/FlaF family flagellin (archaellin)
MKHATSEAVSPVVGVMLMLVVVIIIAAVVSAFAGGLSSSQEKSPTMTIRGTYSQLHGMTIEHTGGTSLATRDVVVMVRPSKTFGSAEHMVWTVNKTSITGATDVTNTSWIKAGGSTGTGVLASGDTAYVFPPYHKREFLQPGSTTDTYSFDAASNIGKTFWLEFADDAGRVFARNEVTIKP